MLPILSPAHSAAIPDGIWELEGYQYILESRSGDLQGFYTVAGSYCGALPRSMADEFGFEMVEFKGRKSIELKAGISRYRARRLAQLPHQCEALSTGPDFNPETNFDAFWGYFDQNYAFFDERNIDWSSVYRRHRPAITENTTPQQLWQILGTVIGQLGDGHATLVNDIRTREQTARGGQVRELLPLLYEYSGKSIDFNRYPGVFLGFREDVFRQLPAKLKPGSHWRLANGMIQGGYVNERTAYLAINEMSGFSDGQSSDEVSAINALMNQVMDRVRGSDSLIVDVRLNPGGDDKVSMAIAERFADKQRLAFTKQARLRHGFTAPQEITVQPGATQGYRRPVCLLAGELTASAAEIFVLAMRVLPQVTVVGEPTKGILSDTHVFVMPNQWMLTGSNERYTAADGNRYEAVGVPPDIVSKRYDKQRLIDSHFDSMADCTAYLSAGR
jgi:hypothetical protein